MISFCLGAALTLAASVTRHFLDDSTHVGGSIDTFRAYERPGDARVLAKTVLTSPKDQNACTKELV